MVRRLSISICHSIDLLLAPVLVVACLRSVNQGELRRSRQHKHIVLLINKSGSRAHVGDAPMGTATHERFSHIGLPCVHHESVWQECPSQSAATVRQPLEGETGPKESDARETGLLLKREEKKHVTVGMIGYPNVGCSSATVFSSLP